MKRIANGSVSFFFTLVQIEQELLTYMRPISGSSDAALYDRVWISDTRYCRSLITFEVREMQSVLTGFTDVPTR